MRSAISTQQNTSTPDTRYGAPGNCTGAAGAEKWLNSCVMNIGEMMAAMLARLATAPCSSPCADGPACLDITLCIAGLAMPPSEPMHDRRIDHPALRRERVAQEADRHEQEAEHDGAALAEPAARRTPVKPPMTITVMMPTKVSDQPISDGPQPNLCCV